MNHSNDNSYRLLDERFPVSEQLPRHFTAEFEQHFDQYGRKRAQLLINGVPVGNELGDNHYIEDGYRFHDVFHLAHAAVLAWSPLLRSLLGCKRKSDAATDDVEDGGRAIMLEETISALTFDYARERNWLDHADEIDGDFLSLIRSLTSHLEVNERSTEDWARTIHRGLEVWRAICENEGGRVDIDLPSRTIRVATSIPSTR